MTKEYLSAEQRKTALLEAAVNRSLQEPYYELTRDEIAAYAGVAAAMVNRCFGTVESLRQEIVRIGIEQQHLRIIADAIARREPAVKSIPKELKQRALASIM